MMFIIDCDVNGGMQLNNDFCVDFGDEPGGPSLAHEVGGGKEVVRMIKGAKESMVVRMIKEIRVVRW